MIWKTRKYTGCPLQRFILGTQNASMQKLLREGEFTEKEKKIQEIENSDKMILQCLLAIINHNITGNGIERMKEIRDELQDFIIKK